MDKTKIENRLSDVSFKEEDEQKMVLEGYAIVFDQETLIGDKDKGFIESIDRNALKNANMKDVPMKYNHDDSFLIIARTRNNSLRLTVDDVGLKVRAELIDTDSNKDIYKMVKAGLLDKMSFAFTVSSQKIDRSGDIPKRTITGIDRLYDVSIVDLPAYDQTSIVVGRSLALVDTELKTMDMEDQIKKANIIKKRIHIKTN
ncbi:MAG: HK97 family phage prohead protease [Bacilli bacterium]|nr:HK97 family phage prohead protease [Bacilli bacterium]MDY5899446.1 HK97 family phage prohead protease [Bacilli bacterium]